MCISVCCFFLRRVQIFLLTSVGPGPGPGPLRSNIASLRSHNIIGQDSVHVKHLLCRFCLFHINHTSHQPQN